MISKRFVREGDHVAHGEVIAEPRGLGCSRGACPGAGQVSDSPAADECSAGGERWQRSRCAAREGRLLEIGSLAETRNCWKTPLRPPIDGVVATPHVENMVGRHLQYGDSFAEVIDTSRAIVDVAVEDSDSGLLRAQEHASVKLNSFPMRIFRGSVMIVSPKGVLQGDSRVFFARVVVRNSLWSNSRRHGGRGKVRVAWYPAGYVLFRKPLMWIYSRAWSWFGCVVKLCKKANRTVLLWSCWA